MIIPSAYAGDNGTVLAAADDGDVVFSEYYFDAGVDNDTGNGSAYNPYKELKSSRIQSNSIIHLSEGEYALDDSVNIYNVTFIGANPQNTIIHYSGTGFRVQSSLTLKNLTLLNLNIENHGTLTASNVKFDSAIGYTGSRGTTYGGAIYSSSGWTNAKVILNNSTFINNHAGYGGAIYMGTGSLEIYDSQFMNNYALLFGGAIACDGVENDDKSISGVKAVINNTRFINDYSSGDAGGAIYLKYSQIDAYKLNVSDCSATFGGAITLLRSNSTFSHVYAINNTARYDGGFIYSMYNKLSLVNSKVENNTANNGAGLFVNQANHLIIANNTFAYNHANICAGAIYHLFYSYFEINNNIYSNNSALTENDLYQTDDINMNIGSNDYTLYVYNSSEIQELPSKYDLRSLNQVTPVKDQADGGNCWTFACLGALESCILKASGNTLDLSEENMKNLFGRFSDYGWTLNTNSGGFPVMAYSYLISWLGPVLEIDDSYATQTTLSPVLNSIMHVQNVLFLKRNNYTDNDAIKRAIMTYGGVHTPIASSALGGYSSTESANHAVVIVGWDDDMSVSGTSKKGAWIVRNSWGPNWSSGGYSYVSYYAPSCAPLGDTNKIYTFILNDTIKYDKNYQYDISGLSDFFINTSSTVWYKNIFNATDKEYLAAVSTFFQKESDWELAIYVNNTLKTTQKGFSQAGYYTIDLNQIIPLNIGDVFEIVFKISVDNNAGVPISERISFNKELYVNNTSFISYDGENWVNLYDLEWKFDTHTYSSQVACIKAFTILNPVNTTVNIEIVNPYNPALIRVTVLNEYGRPVNCGNITLNVEGKNHVVEFWDGACEFNYIFKNLEDNVINASFEKTGFIASSSQIDTYIYKGNVAIGLNIIKDILDAHIKVTLSKPVTETVYVLVNQTLREVNVTNGVGILSFSDLDYGNYQVEAYIVTDGYYCENVTDSFTIDYIKTVIQAGYLDVYYNKGEVTYSIKLVDRLNNPIEDKTMIFNIGDVYGETKTASDGIASYTFKLEVGSYNINVNCTLDEVYAPSFASNLIKIKSTINFVSNTKYTYNSAYKFTLLDKDGNLLSNKECAITVGGKTYSALSDKNGVVSYNLILSPGNYDVCVKNLITGEVKTQKITVVKRITNNNALTMYYGAGSSYKVRVFDDNGNVAKKVKVTFKVSGKTYYRYSDSNGYVSLKIGLNPGIYTITAEYKGVKVSNKITVKPTLITKNIKVKKGKTIKFTAKLLNSKGNILKNKKITFKFKGKTYKVKTNSKGIATLKITKKYKVGKYTITTSYGSAKMKNKITIKK